MKKTLYKLGIILMATPIGTALLKITKGAFKNDRTSKLGDAWWYFFLYNFACRMDLERIKNENKGYRAVRIIKPDFDFYYFYNTVFHLDCISHIIYELSQGYLPVIDDDHHVWEQLFEQPVELMDSKIGDISQLPESDEASTLYTATMIPSCKQVRMLWGRLIRTFSRLKPEEQAYVDNEVSSILKEDRVLGVVCRGTDYIGTGMPRQPEICDLIADAKAWMERYHYDKIYLATEAESIYDQFAAAFKDKLLVNKRSYYDKAMAQQKVKWIGMVQFNRENDNYWKGLEYYSSINILSKCSALLAGYCGASNMALLLNNERYERFKIYDLGLSI